jgi:CRISPR/Cas system-associated exonuclease Cas4 (RecB family)
MFTHLEPKQIEELQTINENNMRLYVTPEGLKYPSVTTVLGWKSKAGILEWRKKVGEEAANKISRQASTRGTKFHYQVEDHINNKEVNFANPAEKDMFTSIEPFLSRINNVHAQEVSLYSDFLKTAGRVDCIAEFDGRLSVIDFKTSSKPKRAEYITNYFQQGSAYAVMYEERTGIAIDTIVIIMAVEGNEPQLFIEKRDNFIESYREVRNEYEEAMGI